MELQAIVQEHILFIRGHRVMIDSDLARIYQTTTKVLNQQVKRNLDRFPVDFMFQLTKVEKDEVVTNCDYLKNLKFSPTLPYAFTEHGAIMLANVVKSEIAVQASIEVVRAFVRVRALSQHNKELANRIDQLEEKYDASFAEVFQMFRALMAEPASPRKRVGFKANEEPD